MVLRIVRIMRVLIWVCRLVRLWVVWCMGVLSAVWFYPVFMLAMPVAWLIYLLCVKRVFAVVCWHLCEVSAVNHSRRVSF